MNKHVKSVDTLRYIAALFFTFVNIAPLLWILLTSFKTRVEIFSIPPIWFPHYLNLENYRAVLSGQDSRIPFLGNSIIISLLSTLSTLLIGGVAAYALARFKFKRKRDLEFWILSTRMMPPIAAAIPLFLIFRNAGLLDSRVGLIVLYTGFNLPFAIWMLTSFFRQVPVDIEEAALLDGCSWYETLRYISIPLSGPGIATVAIFCFLFSWNELLFALLFTSGRAKTLPVALTEYQGVVNIRWELMAAASMIQILPVVIITFMIQRYIIAGLTLGAVKE